MSTYVLLQPDSSQDKIRSTSSDVNPDHVEPASFCGSGSVSMSTKCKAQLSFFLENFLYTVKNIEKYDTYDAEKKDKTMFTGTAVQKK